MREFIDGVLLVAAAGGISSAIWMYWELKDARKNIAGLREILRAEAHTLDQWSKHITEEAKVDYNSLVLRIKKLT